MRICVVFLFIVYIAFCFLSCCEQKKVAKTNIPSAGEVADGSNYERAIVINEKTETK